jgi:hypothetical protein
MEQTNKNSLLNLQLNMVNGSKKQKNGELANTQMYGSTKINL